MTQEIEELHQKIVGNIHKIRVKSLKKLLLWYLTQKFYVKSRRAKYDYKLTIDTIFLIDKWVTRSVNLLDSSHLKEFSKTVETQQSKN